MSDGQDKSDDLIAELAKLMASSAGGAEPEAKPGPKLVSPPEQDAAAPRPAAPTIRIPGMDAPVGATPAAGQAPLVPVIPAAESKPATPAPAIRIPGMDQPVRPAAATPQAMPSTPPPAIPAAPAAAAPVEPKAPSIDFGTLPPAATIRPEPLSNWQDREIPKPVAARPAVAAEPVLTAPVPVEPRPASVAAPTASVAPPASAFIATPPTPRKPVEPAIEADADEQVIAGKPAPEGDGFDFDFGFDSAPPAPIADEPRPAAAAVRSNPAQVPAPAASSGDPIADLISAELDAAMEEEPAPVPARPPVQAPAIRSFPASSQPQPQQQRPVVTNPVRPPVAPQQIALQARQPAAEPDRFATAPVFGVGGKPAAPAPAPIERDPMDEIESLIGEAVRVELSATDKPVVAERPQPAPVVPPLTTGFAPRRAAIKEVEPQVASAEAAILAAAAATGADVGRSDTIIPPESPSASPYRRPKAKPEKKSFLSRGMRQYIGMAVAGTLLLAAGFGLYWVLGMGRGNDAEAPVLTAETTPVKEVPPAPAPKEDATGSVVFNELGGNNTAAPVDEQLVSRDDSTDTSVADVAETVGEDGAATGESELANRKVRTVTVRPDGTIVSGDDAVAGSEALPIDRPNVPAVPGADVQPSELLAALPSNDNAVADPVADAITQAPATDVAALATPDPAATIDPTIVAPVPAARPSDRSVLGGGSNQRVAAADDNAPLDLTASNTPAAAPSAPAISSSGGAYVQLSSQPTTADAQSSLRTTQNRLSGVLNGRSLEIRQVDLGAKGVWYRVVLPVDSFSEATRTCASLMANGTQCVAING